MDIYGGSDGVKVDSSNWGKTVRHYNLEHLDHVNDNVVEFAEVTHQMLELYSRKNRDYGDSFNHSLDEDGLLVAKIRLGDKISRFNSLLKNGEAKVTDESMLDTLIDIANYSVMTVMWLYRNSDESRVYADGQLIGNDKSNKFHY